MKRTARIFSCVCSIYIGVLDRLESGISIAKCLSLALNGETARPKYRRIRLSRRGELCERNRREISTAGRPTFSRRFSRLSLMKRNIRRGYTCIYLYSLFVKKVACECERVKKKRNKKDTRTTGRVRRSGVCVQDASNKRPIFTFGFARTSTAERSMYTIR